MNLSKIISEKKLSVHELRKLVDAAEKYKDAYDHSGISKWFVPGSFASIDKCPKHAEFFRAGREFPERVFMAGNRVGKSVSGSIESACHATGLYPDWWEGKVFNKPTLGWSVGDTAQTTRDTVQKELLGPPGALGTGTIPRSCIIETRPMHGVPDAIDSVKVRHVSGGVSIISFKSYKQGVRSFYGTAQDWIHLDEECPELVYNECLVRTMTTGGIIYVTFTPLHGITPFVVNFTKNAKLLAGAQPIVTSSSGGFADTDAMVFGNSVEVEEEEPDGERGASGRAVIQAGWSDAPWLNGETIERLRKNTPPHLLDARMHGYPSLGSGNVYPVPLEEVLVDSFPIPDDWKRLYAIDVGWQRTAAVWGACNPEDDTVYLYSEYYVGEARPEMHAAGVKARGQELRGVIDPAANGRSQIDGQKLIDLYRKCGLRLVNANNEVESGIFQVWSGLSNGRIKVFKTLQNWQKEYLLYRRDFNGKIKKENDHLMDATRYLINNLQHATVPTARRARNRGEVFGGRKYDL